MSTLLFYLSAFGLGLLLLGMIPGLRELVRPIIQMLFTLLAAIASVFGSWLVVAVKTLVSAHIQLVRHLFKSAEAIDPTVAVRDKDGA